MEMTAKARARCAEMAREANGLELMTLAREWDHIGTVLETAVQNQLRAFDEVSIEEAERIE